MEDLQTIGVTAIVSVVGTLAVTWFGHWLGLSKDRVLRQEEIDRHASYLAATVVCVLEPFVSTCCVVVSDPGDRDREGRLYPTTPDPQLKLPSDVDWRSIRPALMYQILGLPNKIEVAKQSIHFVGAEIAGPPDYDELFEERTIRFGNIGLLALGLADELRQTCGLPPNDTADWDPRQILQTAIDRAEKDRDERNARQRALMDGFVAENH